MSLRKLCSAATLVTVTVTGLACHRMAAVSEPAQYIEGAKPSRIWVTRPSGETFIVEGPQLFGDTLVGYINGEYREIEFSGAEEVVVRQPARTRTVLAVTAGLVGAGAFAYLISGTGTAGNTDRFNTDCEDDPDQPECA